MFSEQCCTSGHLTALPCFCKGAEEEKSLHHEALNPRAMHNSTVAQQHPSHLSDVCLPVLKSPSTGLFTLHGCSDAYGPRHQECDPAVRLQEQMQNGEDGQEGASSVSAREPKLELLWEWECPLPPSLDLPPPKVTCMAWNKVCGTAWQLLANMQPHLLQIACVDLIWRSCRHFWSSLCHCAEYTVTAVSVVDLLLQLDLHSTSAGALCLLQEQAE